MCTSRWTLQSLGTLLQGQQHLNTSQTSTVSSSAQVWNIRHCTFTLKGVKCRREHWNLTPFDDISDSLPQCNYCATPTLIIISTEFTEVQRRATIRHNSEMVSSRWNISLTKIISISRLALSSDIQSRNSTVAKNFRLLLSKLRQGCGIHFPIKISIQFAHFPSLGHATLSLLTLK